jgi:hypothetical protein
VLADFEDASHRERTCGAGRAMYPGAPSGPTATAPRLYAAVE